MESRDELNEALGNGSDAVQTNMLAKLIQEAAQYGGEYIAGHADVIIDSCLAYSDSPVVRQLSFEALRTVPHTMVQEWNGLYSEVKKDIAGNMTAEDGVEPRTPRSEADMRIFALDYLCSLPATCVADFLRSERGCFDAMLLQGEPGASRAFPGTDPRVRKAAVAAYGAALSRPAIVKCLCSSLRDSVLCAADLWEMILECLIDADDSVCAVAFMTVEALLEAHLTSLSRDDCSIGNALVSAVLGWMGSKYAALEERARRLYGEHRLCCLVPLAHAAGSLPKEVRGSLTKVLAHDLLLPELQAEVEHNRFEAAKALSVLGAAAGWEPSWVQLLVDGLISCWALNPAAGEGCAQLLYPVLPEMSATLCSALCPRLIALALPTCGDCEILLSLLKQVLNMFIKASAELQLSRRLSVRSANRTDSSQVTALLESECWRDAMKDTTDRAHPLLCLFRACSSQLIVEGDEAELQAHWLIAFEVLLHSRNCLSWSDRKHMVVVDSFLSLLCKAAAVAKRVQGKCMVALQSVLRELLELPKFERSDIHAEVLRLSCCLLDPRLSQDLSAKIVTVLESWLLRDGSSEQRQAALCAAVASGSMYVPKPTLHEQPPNFELLCDCCLIIGVRRMSPPAPIIATLKNALERSKADTAGIQHCFSVVQRLELFRQMGPELDSDFFQLIEHAVLHRSALHVVPESVTAGQTLETDTSPFQRAETLAVTEVSGSSDPLHLTVCHSVNVATRSIILMVQLRNMTNTQLYDCTLQCSAAGQVDLASAEGSFASITFNEFTAKQSVSWEVRYEYRAFSSAVFHLSVVFGLEEIPIWKSSRQTATTSAEPMDSDQSDDDGSGNDDAWGGAFQGGAAGGCDWDQMLHKSSTTMICLPYTVPPFASLAPVECSLADFTSCWVSLPAAFPFTVQMKGGATLEQLVRALDKSAFSRVQLMRYNGTNSFQLAYIGRTVFDDIAGFTISGVMPVDGRQSSIRMEVRATSEDVKHQLVQSDIHGARELALAISDGVLTVNRGLMGETPLSLCAPCLVERRVGQQVMHEGGGVLEALDWHSQWLLLKNRRENTGELK